MPIAKRWGQRKHTPSGRSNFAIASISASYIRIVSLGLDVIYRTILGRVTADTKRFQAARLHRWGRFATHLLRRYLLACK